VPAREIGILHAVRAGVRGHAKIVRDTPRAVLRFLLAARLARRTIGLPRVRGRHPALNDVCAAGMRRACPRSMNSTFFSIKRGFLRTVNFGRKFLEPFGLTPARFDMLFTLRRGWKLQSQVWRMLGLHPSTVSKMMKKLDDLGLVFRNGDPDNYREVVVRLSPEGETVLEAAIHNLEKDRAVDEYVAWAIAGPHRAASTREMAVLNLEEALLRVRWAFIDSARLLYVFDPDELEPPEWEKRPPVVMPAWPH
jgi:DNA-binding MarR family transcriptional regulator